MRRALVGTAVAAALVAACTSDGDAPPASAVSYEVKAEAACRAAAAEFDASLDRYPTSFPPEPTEWATYLDEYRAIIDRVLEKVDTPEATVAAKAWIADARRSQELVDRARAHALESQWPEVEATMREREALAVEMGEAARAAGLPTCADGVRRAASRG